MRTVIIGNSAAAVGAVEAIRQHDRESAITIVAEEPHHVYSRPLISYLLAGAVGEARMPYRPADFYRRHRVETMLGTRVARVEPQDRTLALAGGSTLTYDRLLIATGGAPVVPPIPGADLDGVFTFIRWEDARRISRHIEAHAVESALVIGGGLIGLKAAEALLARALRITIVELADRILSASFDPTASRLAETALQGAGVELRTGTTVERILGRDGRVDHALLQGGERVGCDLVVLAIGVRPNTSLIPPEAGIEIERGIVVDDRMRTSAPGVYAAGDCAEARDLLLGGRRPIAIWPNAVRQGAVAGCSIAGVEREYQGGFPMNSVDVCGVPTISVGITAPPPDQDGYEIVERYDRESATYKRLVLRDERLVGAICVGEIDRAGIYTGLIREQVDVRPFKDRLLRGGFGLISLPKEIRKHMVVGEGIVV